MRHISRNQPQAVQFTQDEAWRITRVNMARWLGVSLDEWDAMTYGDQCDCLEIRRAEQFSEQWDAQRARARSNARSHARGY